MDGTKNEIKTINGDKEGEYSKNFIKIKFDTDNNLPLNKPLKLRMLTIIVRSVFEEDGTFYLQVIYMGVCMNYKNVAVKKMLCSYWYFKDVGFKFELHVCKKCYNVLMTAYELKTIAMLNVKGVDFRCIFLDISKNEVVNRFSS